MAIQLGSKDRAINHYVMSAVQEQLKKDIRAKLQPIADAAVTEAVDALAGNLKVSMERVVQQWDSYMGVSVVVEDRRQK